MDIKEVSLLHDQQKTALKYDYDGESMLINLGKTFQSKDQYTIYISYVAKPDELKAKGSAAISDAKGLYFINPDGKIPINRSRYGHKEKQKLHPHGFLQ